LDKLRFNYESWTIKKLNDMTEWMIQYWGTEMTECLREDWVQVLCSNITDTNDRVWPKSQTPRRELKKWRAADYFWRTSRCLEMWSNTVLSVWYIFSIQIKTKEKTRSEAIWRGGDWWNKRYPSSPLYTQVYRTFLKFKISYVEWKKYYK